MLFTTDLTRLSDVDLVIDAIFENMDLKRSLYGKLDGICKTSTILATNTSTLDIEKVIQLLMHYDRGASLTNGVFGVYVVVVVVVQVQNCLLSRRCRGRMCGQGVNRGRKRWLRDL